MLSFLLSILECLLGGKYRSRIGLGVHFGKRSFRRSLQTFGATGTMLENRKLVERPRQGYAKDDKRFCRAVIGR